MRNITRETHENLVMFLRFIRTVETSSIVVEAASPRTVNIEIDTSFLFDNADLQSSLVRGLRRFLNKIDERVSARRISMKHHVFLQFLSDLADVLINIDNEKLKMLIDTLSDHVYRAHLDKHSAFNQIFDEKSKEMIKTELISWHTKKPDVLKTMMANSFLKTGEKTVISEFVGKIDDFFTDEDVEILSKIIVNLDRDVNLNDFVEHCLNFVVFERYRQMNETARNNLETAIEVLTAVTRRNIEDVVVAVDSFSGADREKAVDVNDSLDDKNQMVFDKNFEISLKAFQHT